MNDMDVRVVRDWRLKCEGLERVVLGQEDRLDALEKRNAALKADLEASQADLEARRGHAARLQDSLDAIERSTGFVPGNEPLSVWVERAVKERDELKAKLERSPTTLAFEKDPEMVWDDDLGWLHESQHQEFQELLKALRAAKDFFAEWQNPTDTNGHNIEQKRQQAIAQLKELEL